MSDRIDLDLLKNACSREGGDVSVVMEILSRNPDILNKDLSGTGWTALHIASGNGHEEIVQLLLSCREININIQDEKGNTALYCASYNGQVKIIKLLLSRLDIDITILNNDGASAADICCEWYGADKSHREEILQLFEDFEEIKAIWLVEELKRSESKNNNNSIEVTQETISAAESTVTAQKMEVEPTKLNFIKTVSISDYRSSREDQQTSSEFVDEKSFENLKFPSLLRASIISLKILIADNDLKEAKKSKAFAKAIEINKEKKRLKSSFEELAQTRLKVLPAELSSADFFTVKEYTVKQLEDHFEECLEYDDEELLAGIDAFRTKVEALDLISSSPLPMLSTSPAAVKTVTPRSPASPFNVVSVGLNHISIAPHYPPPAPAAVLSLSAGKQFHVFLTHNWADDESGRNNHERVSKINKLLKQTGLITWFDEERMKGQIRDVMCKALYKSMIVLCFITRAYEEKINSGDLSDNCLFEFDLASNDAHLVNQRIAIAMEKSMLNPSNWERERLKSELGGQLIVDMTEDEDKPEIFHQQIEHLITRIYDKLEEINNKNRR